MNGATLSRATGPFTAGTVIEEGQRQEDRVQAKCPDALRHQLARGKVVEQPAAQDGPPDVAPGLGREGERVVLGVAEVGEAGRELRQDEDRRDAEPAVGERGPPGAGGASVP